MVESGEGPSLLNCFEMELSAMPALKTQSDQVGIEGYFDCGDLLMNGKRCEGSSTSTLD